MFTFLAMLGGWIGCDLIWWRSAHLRLANARRGWRWALAVFMTIETGYVLAWFVGALVDHVPNSQPMLWSITAYVWHLLILPLAMGELILSSFGRSVLSLARIRLGTRKLTTSVSHSESRVELAPTVHRWLSWMAVWRADIARPTSTFGVFSPISLDTTPSNSAGPLAAIVGNSTTFTRRDALRSAAAIVPPLAAISVTARGAWEIQRFRIRRVELHLPTLPPDLDGVTIAHVTDLHIGKFLPPGMAERAAEATNALEPDLVAFTGDLIDITARHVRPGIDFIRRLHPKSGLVMIEGNHDVMADVDRFEGEVRAAGLPLLLDECTTVHVKGRRTPIQFMGISWGESMSGRQIQRTGSEACLRFRMPGDEARAASIHDVLAQRQPDAFPILLAHHPHAFDPAAAAGIPLTLAGHTHGGQLMLTEHIGVGPLRFRYWSGLYRKSQSQLFVANGIGNWFPMRLNSPAEIVHLTLKSVPQSA